MYIILAKTILNKSLEKCGSSLCKHWPHVIRAEITSTITTPHMRSVSYSDLLRLSSIIHNTATKIEKSSSEALVNVNLLLIGNSSVGKSSSLR